RIPPERGTRPALRRGVVSRRRVDIRGGRTGPDRRARRGRCRRSSSSGLPRQPEQTLTDDVALGLARTALDRGGARRQQLVPPPAAIDGLLVIGRKQRVRPEYRDGGVSKPLAHARPEQLHEAGLRTELLTARKPSERARVVQSEELDVHPDLREPLARDRIRAP